MCVGGVVLVVVMVSVRGLIEKFFFGVVVGLLGYVVGNYIGFVVAMVMCLVLL